MTHGWTGAVRGAMLAALCNEPSHDLKRPAFFQL